MLTHILVAYDGSLHSLAALDFAGDLAIRYGARVTVLNVIAEDTERSPAEEHLRRADERLRSAGVDKIATMIDVGAPAERIVAFAATNDVDLIVMGRRGFGNLAGFLLGSISQQIVHLADCPVLTVK